LTTAIQAPNVYSYTYDAIGNRTSAQNVAYSYYKNGTNPLNGQRLRNNGGAADFTYDANGNMTGRTGSAFYAWDHLNRLTANHGTSYTYDYLNRRISATTNGVTTNYVPLGLNTIRERTGTTVRDYIFAPGIDEPLAKIENGNVTNYSIDGLGSVVAETDNSGTILNQYAYDWWGGAAGPTPLFGYTGRESAAGGLWFLRARYYDPSIGRFISEDPLPRLLRARGLRDPSDPVAFAASLTSEVNSVQDVRTDDLLFSRDVYAYSNNSPINYRDPTGLQPYRCFMFPHNSISDYVPCGPAGKTYKGCIYSGVCVAGQIMTIASYQQSTPLGARCHNFCTYLVDARGTQIGRAACFDQPWPGFPLPL